MIPVGRIDEILIFLVTARKNGCYIMGIGYIYVIFKFDIAFCPEVNCLESWLLGCSNCLLEIHVC